LDSEDQLWIGAGANGRILLCAISLVYIGI
jgi:hypothetical protein